MHELITRASVHLGGHFRRSKDLEGSNGNFLDASQQGNSEFYIDISSTSRLMVFRRDVEAISIRVHSRQNRNNA